MHNRRAVAVVVALLGVAGLSACSGRSTSSPAESCKQILSTLAPVTDKGVRRATGPALDVDAADAAFTPTCVTDVPRGMFALTAHNTGLVIHDVAIPEQHIDVDNLPRRTVTIQIRIGSTPVAQQNADSRSCHGLNVEQCARRDDYLSGSGRMVPTGGRGRAAPAECC